MRPTDPKNIYDQVGMENVISIAELDNSTLSTVAASLYYTFNLIRDHHPELHDRILSITPDVEFIRDGLLEVVNHTVTTTKKVRQITEAEDLGKYTPEELDKNEAKTVVSVLLHHFIEVGIQTDKTS